MLHQIVQSQRLNLLALLKGEPLHQHLAATTWLADITWDSSKQQ